MTRAFPSAGQGGEGARTLTTGQPESGAAPGPGDDGGPGAHPLDQILHRAFSQISAEAFITDFVRQAMEANRFRGNPPASQFAIDHLKESTLAEDSSESCTVCQDLMEQGAVTLSMPCAHAFHKDCLMPWLQEHNTCPVCRCEVESHCARYNQQNFDKLKGELGTETVSACADCPMRGSCSQPWQSAAADSNTWSAGRMLADQRAEDG
jgi:hypothetical protein